MILELDGELINRKDTIEIIPIILLKYLHMKFTLALCSILVTIEARRGGGGRYRPRPVVIETGNHDYYVDYA